MSRICPNTSSAGPDTAANLFRRVRYIFLACVGVAGAAVSTSQSDETNADGYFAQLTAPQESTMKVADCWIGGKSVLSPTQSVAIRQGQNSTVQMHLVPLVAPTSHVVIRVRVESPSGVAEQTDWIDARTWQVGDTRNWSGTLHMPSFSVSGPATLSLIQLLPNRPNATPEGDGAGIPVDEALLFRARVFVEPSLVPSNVPDDMLRVRFGESIVRMNQSVRLSPTTSVRMDGRLPVGKRCIGIGIVFAMGGGFDVSQGAQVLRVSCEPSGDTIEFRAGADISFIDAAAPPPGVMRLEPTDAIATPPAPFADWHDTPVNANVFAAEHQFDKPASVGAVTLEYTYASGYIDVYDVVCLMDPTSAP